MQAQRYVTSEEQQQYDEAIKESYLAEVARQRSQSASALQNAQRTNPSSQARSAGNGARSAAAEMLSKKYWKEGRWVLAYRVCCWRGGAGCLHWSARG